MIVPTLRLGLGLRFPGPGPSFASTAAIIAAGPAYTTDFTALSALPTGVSLSRATTGTYFDASGVLQTAAIDAARFDHAWNGSAWVGRGLLAEEQRTNAAHYSGDFSQPAWIPGNINIGSPVAGIDGTSDEYPFIPNTSGTTPVRVFTTFGNTTSSAVALTCFVKANGYNGIAIRESTSSGAYVAFDLASGGSVITSGNAAGVTVSNAKITAVGNSRYRISAIFTPTGSTAMDISLHVLSPSYTSGDPYAQAWTANGTSGVNAFGAENQVGAYLTSYIPTTTAGATRSADILSSNSPLTGYLTSGPSVWEFEDEATGTISRTAYAAGAFDWPVGKWYRSMGVYPAGTDTSSHMTVGSAY